jgi:arylsulfatase A-like enzyme
MLQNLIRLTCCLLFVASANAADKMNLLIIQTDEHHFGTLGCYGGRIVGTQNIDWLAKNGVLCTSFYATTPVCSPSRAAFISGHYPQKTPVVTNNIPLSDSVITFAHILKQQGYATGFAGKWHLDGPGKPQWAPNRKFGFTDNRWMYNRGHWKKFEITQKGPRVAASNAKGQANYDLAGADEKSFSTDWLCDRAVDFIHENSDKPFCYYVSLPDPHGPNTVRAPYDTMYANVKVPIPLTLQRQAAQIPNWGKPANGVSAAQLRKIMPAYYGMVKCIDDNVGKLIASLKAEGVLEKTIIVFTSDHGDLCGEHGRLNKGVPYEGSARVPFIVCAPSCLPSGKVVNEALTSVDFFPTIMALLGAENSQAVDGRDASELLAGKATNWHDIAFMRSTPNQPWLSAVTSRFKLVISKSDKPWLIDLQADPAEIVNLYGQDKHDLLIRRLTEELRDYTRKYDDPHARIPEIRQQLFGNTN